MRHLMREMTRPFGDFFALGPPAFAGIPPLEIQERDGHMVVRVELPGVRKEDVKVRVLDDALVIEGERRNEREVNRREGFYESEFSYGRFSRRIQLPGRVDPGRVKAKFQNGVLEIEVHVETPSGRDVPIEGDREMAEAGGRHR